MAGGHMSRKYFGTDGIRGRANGLITPELALKVGQAAGLVFQRGDHRHRVVIGKDTRLSGYMIEYAMVAGFTSVGMDVLLLGPMPTPAVAMLTKSMRADLGVMISASHNLFEDNGIKLFGPQGFKLSDDVEKQIEQLLDEPIDRRLAQSASLGRARRIDGVHDRYIEFAKRTLPRELSLDGLRVVIDCAQRRGLQGGAGSAVGLGRRRDCDRRRTRRLQHQQGMRLDLAGSAGQKGARDARRHRHRARWRRRPRHPGRRTRTRGRWRPAARGDRAKLEGRRPSRQARHRRHRDVEPRARALPRRAGARMVRTPVGDRYVLEQMLKHGYNLGGEPSGHIILSDYATTGDGFVAALQVLAVVQKLRRPVSEVCHRFDPLPQILKNVRYRSGKPLDDAEVKSAIDDGENRLNGHGRLLVRSSGTEPVIRVMGEGDDRILVEDVVDHIVTALGHAAAA